MSRYLQLFPLWLIASGIVCTKPGYTIPSGNYRISVTDTDTVYLKINNTFFLKNNEYFSPLSEGWTGIGNYIQAQIVYKPGQDVILEAGLHALLYYGTDSFDQLLPLFSASWQARPHWRLTVGHINNFENHYLTEALYRTDRFYEHPVEYGFQSVWHSPRFYSDTWLEWARFIYRDNPYQEEILAGTVNQWTSGKEHRVRVSVLLQSLIAHKGGQIDNSPDAVQTLWNGMSGFSLEAGLTSSGGLVSGLDSRIYWYNALSVPDYPLPNSEPFTKGYATSLGLWLQNNYWKLSVAYWHAYHFIAPKGEVLLGSVSELNSEYTLPERKMLLGRFNLSGNINKYFTGGVFFYGYYDMPARRFDFSYGLKAVFRDRIFLGSVKHRPGR